MQRPSTPVKPAGQTGDREVDLLHKRIARRKAAYEKLCSTIERRQRKLDRDQRSVERNVKALAKLERLRSRWRKAIDKIEREAADAAVVSTVETPAPKPVSDVTEVTELTSAGGFGITLDDKGNGAKPKPKRERKPKAGSPGPKLLEEMLNKPFIEARKKREAKMKAMGFRKT